MAPPTTLDPGTEQLPAGAGATPALLVAGDPSVAPSTPGLISPMNKMRLIGGAFLMFGLVALVVTLRFARKTRRPGRAPARSRRPAPIGRATRPAHATRTSNRDLARRAPSRGAAELSTEATVAAFLAGGPDPVEPLPARWRQPARGAGDDFERTLEERVPTLM